MSAGDRRVGVAQSASTSAALLIGMVAYGVFLTAGPPVSRWDIPLGLAIPVVVAYGSLTAFAWHLLLKRSTASRRRAILIVGAAAGAITLVVFGVFNILVIFLGFVLQWTGL